MKKNVVLILFVVVSMFFSCTQIEAKTLGELKQELANMKQKYESNKSEKELTEAEISKVEQEIEGIHVEIDKLNQNIEELKIDIENRNKEIEKMNKEIKSIMNYYQLTNNDLFYLQYLFEATDYTDFIYRLAITEQLSEYRKKTVDQFKKLIEENNKKIEEMSSKKVELNKLEKELNQKFDKLETQLTGIKMTGVNIKDEIEDLQTTINLYQNTYKCSDTEQIDKCINRHNLGSGSSASGNYNVPSAYGFYVPIAYWTRIYEFQHHDNGLDLSTPEGQTVTPIADGVVIDIWYKYDCGGNMVWVAHNVNGKKYTSGYFHLKSINVSIDQTVTHNTVLGYSGGAKRGTSTNSYDNCTTGPHLHLQVATGHYARNRVVRGQTGLHISWSAWNGNSFNPRNIINF